MNKKFNLLALAAAASACGALVLTSCGGSSGGANVIFWTNGDLRNEETGAVIRVPNQKVAYGKYAKAPDLQGLQRKKAVRWTWTTDKETVQPLEVKGWSYENEAEVTNDFNFTKTPITKDTILYPYYKENTSYYTITLEPVDTHGNVGKWNKEAQKNAHIYDDNYFEEGTTGSALDTFKACVIGASTLITPPKGYKFQYWYEEGKDESTRFEWSSLTEVTDNLVLIAHYGTN